MVFETITLTIITLLLLVLTCLRKSAGKLKLLLGVLTAVSALLTLVCFVLMMKTGGRLNSGALLYVPCGIYGVIALVGIVTAALSRRKLRIEKAARDIVDGKKEI